MDKYSNIIIDGQMLQTEAWHRGMGKYLVQILINLNDNNEYKNNIKLIFNKNLNIENLDRVKIMKSLCPNIEIKILDLPLPKSENANASIYKKKLEKFIDTLWRSDDNIYLLTSIFLFDFYSEYPSNCRNYLIFYDLIPLIFWNELGGYFPQELYFSRFNLIYEADRILAISNTTKKDLTKYLGVNPSIIDNINGGFTKISSSPISPKNFKVPEKYILMPTGDLPHKNNILAVKAYGNMENKKDIKLVITSNFKEESMRELKNIEESIIFSGNVTDDELEWLYRNSEVVLFASKYEGLGLPVLDAIYNYKPLVLSNISVFKEMSEDAFYYFDEDKSSDLTEKLNLASNKINFSIKKKYYSNILDKYTWTNSANRIIESFKNKYIDKLDYGGVRLRPRIAVCSLHPGINFQIVEPLLYSLNKYFEVDIYLDPNGHHYLELERPTYLEYVNNINVLDISSLNDFTFNKYDLIVFIIDKHSLPSRLAQRAFIFGGVLIYKRDTNLTDQQRQLESIILDKMSNIFEYPHTYKEYSNIALTLFNTIKK